MSDKQKHKNPRTRQNVKKQAAPLTPEEQAKIIAAREQAEKEANEEQARLQLYGRSVEKMSHRQLRSELVKTIRREHAGRPPVGLPGLTIAFATVLLTVLDNTKTSPVFETDKNGKPTRVARLDQINQLGRLHAYPL